METPTNERRDRDTDRRRLMLGAAAWCAGAGACAAAGAATRDEAEAFEGVWSGFIAQDDPPAQLTLRITNATTAALTVVGVGAIVLTEFRAADRGFRFAARAPALVFEGERNAAGEVVGAIRRGDERIPLSFVRGDLYTEPPLPTLPSGPVTVERLRWLRQAARCPAMGVAWRRRGEPIRVLVDGRRSAEAAARVARSDRWHLGSVTKNMTATLAARLVEQRRIAWDTPLSEVLGDTFASLPAAHAKLTLLHLLSHHAGLARDVPASAYASLPAPLQRQAYLRAALQQPPVGAAGAEMNYSNVDYVIAGLMLERVGGAAWETLVTRHVFEPLGLRDVGFGPPGTAASVDQPQGHRMGARGLEPVRSDVPFALGPAGRVNMSLRALVTYLCAHRDRMPGFLSAASWRTLHTPPFGSSYALGWEVGPGGALVHGGTNGWWKSEVRVDPERGFACAAVTNVLNVNGQNALLQLEDAAALS